MADEKEAPQKQGEQGGDEQKEKKGVNFAFIGALAGVLVVNTIIAFVLIQLTRPENPAEKEQKARADSLKTALAQATAIGSVLEEKIEAVVNIAGTDGARFLKVVVVLEYDDKEFPRLGEELIKRLPKFKDMLIDQLSKMTLVELNEPDVKNRICSGFKRMINNSLGKKQGEISNVYVDQFIIQ